MRKTRSLLEAGFILHIKDGGSNPFEFDGVGYSALATRLLSEAVKAGRIRLVDATVGYRSWRYVPHWGQ